MLFFKQAGKDIPAGIVVFFVAVPLCLGIAMASGAPLFSGLIAGIIGGTLVGMMSGSPLGVSGPAAGLAVIVLDGIAEVDGFSIFLVAIVLAGIIQLILGLSKAGIIAYYFPNSVIKGMLAGIGIIIILKQIPHAFGYDADFEGDMSFLQPDGENTFTELLKLADFFSINAIIVSALSMFILLLWEFYLGKKGKFFDILQGPTAAVLVGIIYEFVTSIWFQELEVKREHLVQVPVWHESGSLMTLITFPDWKALQNPQIYVLGFTVAIVASLETLLCVEATDKLDPQKRITPANRELVAQGTGNIVSGLIGGLPITQVIVRSSANIQSGGKTKLSAIFHGFLILTCVLLIPDILNRIPLASLAAVLIVVGFKLAKPSLFKEMYKQGYAHLLPFIVTILGIIFLDLLKGIALGMIVAIFIILRNSYKNSHFLHTQEVDNGGHKITMTLAEEVTFLNKGAIMDAFKHVEKGTEIIIDISQSVRIDTDVLEIIEDFEKQAEKRELKVKIIRSEQS